MSMATSATYSLDRASPFTSWLPSIVFVLAAFGSLVFIEPAPVDGLTILAAIALFGTGLRLPREFLIPMLLLFVFLLGNVLSSWNASESAAAIIYGAVTAYLVLALVLYTGLMYWDYERLMTYFWGGYIVAAVIASTFAIIGFFQLVPQHELFTLNSRGAGTFKDPNVFGPFLVPLILYLLHAQERRSAFATKAANLALILFLLFGLLVSFSRGAMLNFVVSLLIMVTLKLYVSGSLRQFTRYFTLGTLAALSLVALLVIAVLTTDRLQEMVEVRGKVVQDYDVGKGGRFTTQLIAIGKAAEMPLGVGPGESDVLLGIEPHNVYLLVLVENGLLGFIGWVGFFGLTVIQGARAIRQSLLLPRDFIPVYAGIIGILLESFIIDSIHWRFLFVLAGIQWGMMLAVRSQQRRWLNPPEIIIKDVDAR